MFEILQSILIVCLSYVVTIYVGRKLKLGPNLNLITLSVHTFYSVVYWYLWTQVGYSDVIYYYNAALVEPYLWEPGTTLIITLMKVLVVFFNLKLFDCFLVFNILGVIGVQLLLRVLLDIWPKFNNKISWMPYLIMLMPGHHLWSGAPGKDAIAYLSVTVLVFGLHRSKYNVVLIGIFLMFLTRPHISLVMVLALIISLAISHSVNKHHRWLLFFLGLVAYFLIDVATQFIGMGAFSLANLLEFIEGRRNIIMPGDSSYDPNEVAFIVRLYRYILAPLFFDARSFSGLIVSFENLFLLIFFTKYILLNIINIVKRIRTPIISFSAVYCLVMLVIMTITTTNVGIALRQKYMIVPILLVLGSMLASKHYNRLKAI